MLRHREVPEKGKAPAGPPGGGMGGMDYQARDTEVQELNAEGVGAETVPRALDGG